MLGLPIGRGAETAVEPLPQPHVAAEVVLRHETTHPTRCGACGGYHALTAAGCPVGAHQRALARGFRRNHEGPHRAPEPVTKEEERGS